MQEMNQVEKFLNEINADWDRLVRIAMYFLAFIITLVLAALFAIATLYVGWKTVAVMYSFGFVWGILVAWWNYKL